MRNIITTVETADGSASLCKGFLLFSCSSQFSSSSSSHAVGQCGLNVSSRLVSLFGRFSNGSAATGLHRSKILTCDCSGRSSMMPPSSDQNKSTLGLAMATVPSKLSAAKLGFLENGQERPTSVGGNILCEAASLTERKNAPAASETS